MQKPETVFVGMSGGVDSSVSALRLKKQGYNVVGVFIKVWHPDFMVCNWEQERLDAMRVAAQLNIPFLTCDAEKAYKQGVADYFIAEYKAGRTPNPDVMCNKEVKFGIFLDFAKQNGADYIATGHYVQRIDGSEVPELHRGVDENKDQSYFLWTLSKEQLAKTLFPVGDTPKEIIRKEAESAGLLVADKKDSQGICFLGHVDIPDFLAHYIDLKPGTVLDTEGQVIGEHKGALVYTLGQRHGFTIKNSNDNRQAQYIIAKDIEKNTITVSSEKPNISETQEIKLTDVILRSELKDGEEIDAQFRYRQAPFAVKLKNIASDTAIVVPFTEVEKPSAGQSCVLYRGSLCIGGGIIE